MGRGGFEPPKTESTDLQSVAFNHFATYPSHSRAGDGTRTRNLLITNQLLYQLSYTSSSRSKNRDGNIMSEIKNTNEKG